MKKLIVNKLHTPLSSAQQIPAAMDAEAVAFQPIANANWAKDFPYTPDVSFRMTYSDAALYIHYRVTEDSVRAVAPHDNGKVWEDTCCEFFSQPVDDGTYYNMECNCSGTILVGCGREREGRILAPQAILNNIDRWSSLSSLPFDERIGHCEWQLALIIPLKTFFMHNVSSLEGKTLKANFYKCGDALQKPHFLSWNAIEIEKPDFHRPDFFGEIKFQ